MQNGLMTIEKTEEQTKAFFIDQDVLECARLNLRTKNRVGKYEKDRAAKVRHAKRMRKTANRILAEAGFGGAVAFAGSLGLIAPVIWIPVAIISLCVACLRLGMWYGRAVKKPYVHNG